MRKKLLIMVLSLVVVLGLMTSGGYCATTGSAIVTESFTTMKDDLMTTLGAVGAIAVTILAVFLAWKYGKKIFNKVAN